MSALPIRWWGFGRQELFYLPVLRTHRVDLIQASWLTINQPQSFFEEREHGLRPCWSKCGPKSRSTSITFELVRNAEYGGHPGTTEAESALYQDPQVIGLHIRAWEALGSRQRFSFTEEWAFGGSLRWLGLTWAEQRASFIGEWYHPPSAAGLAWPTQGV